MVRLATEFVEGSLLKSIVGWPSASTILRKDRRLVPRSAHPRDRDYPSRYMFNEVAHESGALSLFYVSSLVDCLSRSTPSVHDGGSLAGNVPIKLRSISSSLISLRLVRPPAGSTRSLPSVIFFAETPSLFCFRNDLHRYLAQLLIKSAFAPQRPPIIKIYFHRPPHCDPAGNR